MSFNPYLGGNAENKIIRLQIEKNVIRVLLQPGGAKTAELFTFYDKIWRPINHELAELLVSLFGARALEFLDQHSILRK